MTTMNEIIQKIGDALWSGVGLTLVLCVGVFLSFVTRFFQIRRFFHWFKSTAGALFSKKSETKKSDGTSISQFQAVCTALASTVGVGNIAGVASAIVCGGPGAVFWMWAASFLSMILAYCENLLGIFYRQKNEKGELVGGAMYYIRDGLKNVKGFRFLSKILSFMFAFFCIGASFGIGNAGQINTIVVNLQSAFKIPFLSSLKIGNTNLYCVVVGVTLSLLTGFVLIGGTRRIARVTERLVPFMVLGYIGGAFLLVFCNSQNIFPSLKSVFSHAFSLHAAAGGVSGYALREVIGFGLRRGIFSNEAGMGSTVTVNSASFVKEPVLQGMWGIFEVFVDTTLMCTVTALTILCSGLVDLESGKVLVLCEESALVSAAFNSQFGYIGSSFIAVSLLLFAYSSVLGWSYNGLSAWEFLFGADTGVIYKAAFSLFVVAGAVMNARLAWNLSDVFNAFMMLPNLFGIVLLSKTVLRVTKNYEARHFKKAKIKPLLSARYDL